MSIQPELSQDQLPPELAEKPQNKRKKFLIIAGAALLVIVLAGAAYLAGTLMNKKNNAQNGPQNSIQGAPGSGSVFNKTINKSDVTPAKELPAVEADVRGVYLSRTGNSINIGTGMTTIGIMKNESGGATPQVSYNGPTYEVVITKDTVIYKDTTQIDPAAASTDHIQQTVAIGSLDDLDAVSMISVWGKKTGDRYVADIILYASPLIKMGGGTGGASK